MMTRTHFEAIAAILQQRRRDPNGTIHEVDTRRETIDAVASDLAHYFSTVNDAFKRARFLAACK